MNQTSGAGLARQAAVLARADVEVGRAMSVRKRS